MKAKRLTALALAALMAASTTSVALAAPGDVDKDQALNFYDGAVGDDLYMMDEDGYIRAAVDGDFAPGDDIYLALKEYPSASSTEFKRMNVYADWAVGKSWVDDVDIVYKKGQWKTSEASKKIYTVQGTGITAFDNVSVTTSKTEASSIRSEILAKLENKRSAAESEVFGKYVIESKTAYSYDGKDYESKELLAKAAADKGLYVFKDTYYKVDGGIVFDKPTSATEGVIKGGTTLFLTAQAAIDDAKSNSGWVPYVSGTHGSKYVTTTGEGMGTLSDGDTGSGKTLAQYISENDITEGNVYVDNNNSPTKFVVSDKVQLSKLGDHLGGTYASVTKETFYKTEGATNTVLNVDVKNNGYFEKGGNTLVGGTGDAEAVYNAMKSAGTVTDKTVTTYTIEDGSKVDEATAKAAAAKKVQTIFDEIKNNGKYISAGVEAPATFSGNPTGSYDGYNTESGYAYWVKISTKESTGTKDIDLVGDISIGRTKTSAKGNEVTLGVTLTNTDNANKGDYTDREDDVYIEPGERAVVSFADDASDEFTVEFGDDAYFVFNARGQGKLNLAYNTKYNKDFAYDYDDANIDFINFEGEPTTNRTGTLYIYADEDSYIYEVTSKGAKKINGAYYDDDEEAWVIRTRNLTSYAISDKKLKTVDQMDNGSSSNSSNKPGSSNNKPGNGKPNPDTGR